MKNLIKHEAGIYEFKTDTNKSFMMVSKQKKIEFLDGFIDLWDSHNICDNPKDEQIEVLNAVYDLVANALDLPKEG